MSHSSRAALRVQKHFLFSRAGGLIGCIKYICNSSVKFVDVSVIQLTSGATVVATRRPRAKNERNHKSNQSSFVHASIGPFPGAPVDWFKHSNIRRDKFTIIINNFDNSKRKKREPRGNSLRAAPLLRILTNHQGEERSFYFVIVNFFLFLRMLMG